MYYRVDQSSMLKKARKSLKEKLLVPKKTSFATSLICASAFLSSLAFCKMAAAQNAESNYQKEMSSTAEQIGSQDEVIRKVMQRPIPSIPSSNSLARFGVHGMFWPFVIAEQDQPRMRNAFELLARVGVQTLRSNNSEWHFIEADKYKQLDYQVANASKYGMKFLLTVGYPPQRYNVGPSIHSTFKDAFEPQYRQYLSMLLNRYSSSVAGIEVGNEVDAYWVWWINATPEQYVRDCRISREEAKKINPNIQVIAFGSTWSRYPADSRGRDFVSKVFDLDIDRYVDAYSLHYTWRIVEKNFTGFFRQRLAAIGSGKPLIDSEESTARPSEIIKAFTRDFFLYGYASVYYFQAKDFYENGKLQFKGLFDKDWNPKLRLLAYAAAFDALKDRVLVGIGSPAPGVEAYVLRKSSNQLPGPTYSIVLWKNEPNSNIEGSRAAFTSSVPVATIDGLTKVASALNWKLDPIVYDARKPRMSVGIDPIVVYSDAAPSWPLSSAATWLANH